MVGGERGTLWSSSFLSLGVNMRRIDLQPYVFVLKEKEIEVNIVDVLESILMTQATNPRLLIARADVWRLTKAVVEIGQGFVDLDTDQYRIIVSAMDAMSGFTRVHEQFVRRIYGAPTPEASE